MCKPNIVKIDLTKEGSYLQSDFVPNAQLRCDVCGKIVDQKDVSVCASIFGPMSFAYCPECAKSGREPYWAMVDYIAVGGHFPDDINEMYQEECRRQLKLHSISEKKFIEDVDKAVEEYRHCYE